MWTDKQLETATRLIANLIGPEDRSGELQDFLFLDLPAELAFPERILNIILSLGSEGVAPTFDNIALYLQNETSEDYSEALSQLVTFQTEDRTITPLVYILRDTVQKTKTTRALSLMQGIFANPKLTQVDAYLQAMEVFKGLAPFHKGHIETFADTVDQWLARQETYKLLQESGRNIGPCLPWASTWEILPYMRPKELCLIYGVTGFGKSTIAQLIGEDVAHRQGYDVLFTHLETDPLTYMSRVLSRELRIPLKELERGWYVTNRGDRQYLDVNRGELGRDVQGIVRNFKQTDREVGTFYYNHAPGASVERIAMDVQRYKERAERRGRKLVLVLDYVQNLDWSAYKASAKTQGLNIAAERLKNLAETEDINIIAMAQAQLENALDRHETPQLRDANEFGVKSQTVIRVDRQRATEDDPIYLNAQLDLMIDRIGSRMFYHRKGEWDSSTVLRLIKANNSSTSEDTQGYVKFVNAYYTIRSTNRDERPA